MLAVNQMSSGCVAAASLGSRPLRFQESLYDKYIG